jgi:antitoxin component of RelBE/YafQ-DinJ toxin-antitoxin module
MKTEIRIRINKQLKMEVEAALKPYGMRIQDLIRYFLEEIASGRYDPRQLLIEDKNKADRK